MGYDNISFRVIKPYKEFYNELISVALKYGIGNLQTVTVSDFIDAIRHSFGSLWKAELEEPAKAFYNWCKSESEFDNNKGTPGWFENVKYKMSQVWEAEIIQKSNDFKKAKREQY